MNAQPNEVIMKPKFVIGERVLCFEPDSSKARVLYDAKILDADVVKDGDSKKEPEYKIHFQGWNSAWDRWADESFVLKDNEESRKLQRKLLKKALKQWKGRRRKPYLPGCVNALKNVSQDHEDDSGSSSDDGNSTTSSLMAEVPDDGDYGSDQAKRRRKSSSTRPSEEWSGQVAGCSSDSLEPPHELPAPYPLHPHLRPRHLNLELPHCLRNRLHHDNVMVTERRMLVELPAKLSVSQILENYIKHFALNLATLPSSHSKLDPNSVPPAEKNFLLCKEMCEELRILFDFVLPILLLYHCEREQCQRVVTSAHVITRDARDHLTTARDSSSAHPDDRMDTDDHVDHDATREDHVTAREDHVTARDDHVTVREDHVTAHEDRVTAHETVTAHDHVTLREQIVAHGHVNVHEDVVDSHDHVKARDDNMNRGSVHMNDDDFMHHRDDRENLFNHHDTKPRDNITANDVRGDPFRDAGNAHDATVTSHEDHMNDHVITRDNHETFPAHVTPSHQMTSNHHVTAYGDHVTTDAHAADHDHMTAHDNHANNHVVHVKTEKVPDDRRTSFWDSLKPHAADNLDDFISPPTMKKKNNRKLGSDKDAITCSTKSARGGFVSGDVKPVHSTFNDDLNIRDNTNIKCDPNIKYDFDIKEEVKDDFNVEDDVTSKDVLDIMPVNKLDQPDFYTKFDSGFSHLTDSIPFCTQDGQPIVKEEVTATTDMTSSTAMTSSAALTMSTSKKKSKKKTAEEQIIEETHMYLIPDQPKLDKTGLASDEHGRRRSSRLSQHWYPSPPHGDRLQEPLSPLHMMTSSSSGMTSQDGWRNDVATPSSEAAAAADGAMTSSSTRDEGAIDTRDVIIFLRAPHTHRHGPNFARHGRNFQPSPVASFLCTDERKYACASPSIPSNVICQESYVGSAGNDVKRAVYLAQAWKLRIFPADYRPPDGAHVPCSLVYGIHHFLRLFVKLPAILGRMNFPEEKLRSIHKHVELLLRFLASYEKEIYELSGDYVTDSNT